MVEPNEDEIRRFAHQPWEKAGPPEGPDKEFWGVGPVRTPDNL